MNSPKRKKNQSIKKLSRTARKEALERVGGQTLEQKVNDTNTCWSKQMKFGFLFARSLSSNLFFYKKNSVGRATPNKNSLLEFDLVEVQRTHNNANLIIYAKYYCQDSL